MDKVNTIWPRLYEALADYPAAAEFIRLYAYYAHLVDDVIDEEDFKNAEKILEMSHVSTMLYANPFYRQHAQQLVVVDAIANIDFLISTMWEKSEVEWKKKQADILRHSCLYVVFAVLYITLGYEGLRQLAPDIRTIGHEIHLNDLINYGNNK